MTTQEILQGVHDWTNGKIVYDISVAHPDGQGNPTKYANLTAALGTGGANIPETLRKGGMSVKFILSSDNKYVQYRFLLSGSFTDAQFANTDNWSFCGDDVLLDNDEFVKVVTDKDGRVLYGIKSNGDFYFGNSCPPQVKDYLRNYVAPLFDEKVDKVQNESLIPTQYISNIQDSQFVQLITDAEEKVLIGIFSNGDVFFGNGCPSQIKDFINNKVAGKVDSIIGKSLIDEVYAECSNHIDNIEYIKLVFDADGKILFSIDKNGKVDWGVGVPKPILDYLHDYNEFPIDFGKPDIADSYLVVGDGNEGGRNRFCIAIGKRVMTHNTGIKNMTVGYDNMADCSGHDNTSMGYHASFRNTEGNCNCAFGSESQDDNTTGDNNVSLGYCALQRNNTGSNNVAIGVQAIAGASYPSYDSSNPKHYNYNVAIGSSAMYQALTESEDNIAIGHASLPTAKKYTHCISIGRYADCDKDYQAVLGGNDTVETLVRGNFVVKGTDGIKRKIIFNQDGSVVWETVS